MPPDILLWLVILVIKMTAAAAVVVAATLVAERAGPFMGAMIATLPLTAGPAYVFVAFDHDAAFISESAVGTLAVNAATAIYGTVYVKLARRQSLVVCMTVGIGAWLAVALPTIFHVWTLPQAIVFNAITYPIGIWLVRHERHAPMPRIPTRWTDMAVRAIGVALPVAVVVTLSSRVGPSATGIMATIPIVYTSIMIILYRRVGGPAAAAVIAHSLSGLVGFGCAVVMLHFAAIQFGKVMGLLLAIAVSVGWNLMLFTAGRVRMRVSRPA